MVTRERQSDSRPIALSSFHWECRYSYRRLSVSVLCTKTRCDGLTKGLCLNGLWASQPLDRFQVPIGNRYEAVGTWNQLRPSAQANRLRSVSLGNGKVTISLTNHKSTNWHRNTRQYVLIRLMKSLERIKRWHQITRILVSKWRCIAFRSGGLYTLLDRCHIPKHMYRCGIIN